MADLITLLTSFELTPILLSPLNALESLSVFSFSVLASYLLFPALLSLLLTFSVAETCLLIPSTLRSRFVPWVFSALSALDAFSALSALCALDALSALDAVDTLCDLEDLVLLDLDILSAFSVFTASLVTCKESLLTTSLVASVLVVAASLVDAAALLNLSALLLEFTLFASSLICTESSFTAALVVALDTSTVFSTSFTTTSLDATAASFIACGVFLTSAAFASANLEANASLVAATALPFTLLIALIFLLLFTKTKIYYNFFKIYI